MDIILYIDCDGVVFDTIKVAEKSLNRLGLDIKDKSKENQDKIHIWFNQCNWTFLIENAGQIDNSCKKINKIKESNLFESVIVLTHACSFNEIRVKNHFFKKLVPGIQVIGVPRKIEKHWAVNSHGQVLIDDSKRKITSWINDGGIGVLFNQEANGLSYPDSDKPYYETNNLLDLIQVYEDIKSKRKVLKK